MKQNLLLARLSYWGNKYIVVPAQYTYKIVTGRFKKTDVSVINGINFKILVVATMSAGKSTLLNAMIGKKLLPSKNEACTSTLYCIEDYDDKQVFVAKIKDSTTFNLWREVDETVLSEWNRSQTSGIQIRGDLPFIKNSSRNERVIFYDTPGPNNSMNDSHSIITKNIIAKSGYSAILFVLNAEMLEVNDDWSLLQEIRKRLQNRRNNVEIIFVLNKIDLFNTEKQEQVIDIVNRVRTYLQEAGFALPLIFPVCSKLSLSIRLLEHSSEKITLSQKWSYCSGFLSFLGTLCYKYYQSLLSPRKQAALHSDIVYWTEHADEFKAIWTKTPLFAEIYEELEKEAIIPLHLRRYRVGDYYHSQSELDLLNILTGVPCLERYLEKRLFSISKQNRKDDEDED